MTDIWKRAAMAAGLATLLFAGCGHAAEPDLTTANAPSMMTPGVNLGNTLEAIPAETSWGNPVPTQALMDGYKAAGFKSIRIPVAWSQYADAGGAINAQWMAHVTEVVDAARKAGLIVIINVHWDGGWIQPTKADAPAVNARLARFWTQIATNFRDYDDHLLFAGTNEIAVKDVYTAPTAENCEAQKSFNQTFVDAVRVTGGNNATRFLVVQGYNTNIDYTVDCNRKLPADSADNRLMMEVHYYDPYDFTLNENSPVWQWGKIAKTPSATQTWANESYVDGQFRKMKSNFVARGVPVILGEYGAYTKTAYPGMDPYRLYWDGYITRSAVEHGVIPMYWDTGGIIDRTTGAPKDTAAITEITGAAQ